MDSSSVCYTECMKKKVVVLAGLLLAGLLIFWFYYPLRSFLVMGVYSGQHSAQSVQKQHGFSVDIPSGPGWYPFVMTYNADGFSAWSGIDADMSVLYNFGAFDSVTRTSSIYDAGSDKYCAFYGAYVLHQNGGTFGLLEDGSLNRDEIESAVAYDYTQLVVAGFGCDDIVFRVDGFESQPDVSYAGSNGWTRIDADLTANGVAHTYKQDYQAYLQYGPPVKPAEQDFMPVSLKGRLYLKYLEEYDCTVMLYVIAPNEAAADACDKDILSRTIISPLKQ